MKFERFFKTLIVFRAQNTAPKLKFSVKDSLIKCDQICSFLRNWSHLLMKSSMENSIFCAVRFVCRTFSVYCFCFKNSAKCFCRLTCFITGIQKWNVFLCFIFCLAWVLPRWASDFTDKQTLNSVKPAQESSSENLWKKNTTRLTNFYFHCVKCVHIQSFSAPYFPAFGLYFPHSINLYIQSKIGKIQTRKNLNTNTFQVSFFMHRRVYFHISITYFKQIYNFLYNGLEVKENINFMEMCEA